MRENASERKKLETSVGNGGKAAQAEDTKNTKVRVQKTRSSDIVLQEIVAKNVEDAAARMSKSDTHEIPSRSESTESEHKRDRREGAEVSREKPEGRGAPVTEAAEAAVAHDVRDRVSNSKLGNAFAHSARGRKEEASRGAVVAGVDQQNEAEGASSSPRLTPPGHEESKKHGLFEKFTKKVKKLMTRRREGGKEGEKKKSASKVEKNTEKGGRTKNKTKEEKCGGKVTVKNEDEDEARSEEE
jgi:hypothetical protein